MCYVSGCAVEDEVPDEGMPNLPVTHLPRTDRLSRNNGDSSPGSVAFQDDVEVFRMSSVASVASSVGRGIANRAQTSVDKLYDLMVGEGQDVDVQASNSNDSVASIGIDGMFNRPKAAGYSLRRKLHLPSASSLIARFKNKKAAQAAEAGRV
jgi:hypothetical protein